MGIKRKFTQEDLSWVIAFECPTENTDISNPVDGSLVIEFESEVQYPINVGVRAEGDNYEYVEFAGETTKSLASSSDLPVEFQFNSTSGNKRPETEIWFSDNGDKGDNYPCRLTPAEVVNLCCRILSDDDSDAIISDMTEFYACKPSIAYSDFRDDARYCTKFEQYVEIFDFLYENDDYVDDIEGDVLAFIKDRIIGIDKSPVYKSDSVEDLENKMELISSKNNLPDISEENRHGLRGYYYVTLAEQAVRKGDFKAGTENLSAAIEHFEDAEGEVPLQPSILKRHAVEGLIAESKTQFNRAADLYSAAAEEAESTKNEKIYEVWAQLCESKQQLIDGKLEEAQQSIRAIEASFGDVGLIDLRKLSILVELLENYQRSGRSDAHEIFNRANVEIPSQESVLQYNTDYSTAYTMLLTRQRHKQLNMDSGFDEPFQVSLEDALTPTGIAKNQESTETTPSDSVTRENNSVEVVEREYAKTQHLQRDITFSEDVKQIYNETCAVCGSQRRTPDGRPEVEAAHIRSVEKGGPDIVRNGVALCRLHHWAFDNGWLSIDDDYSILVQESPNVNGYDDFIQFEGKSLHLPTSEKSHPEPDYLQFHRQEYGFE